MARPQRSESAQAVVERLSGRRLTWSGAVGLTTRPYLVFPIVIVAAVLASLVPADVPGVVALMGMILVLDLLALVAIRRRVGVSVADGTVVVRNLVNRVTRPLAEVAGIEEGFYRFGNGPWFLRLVTAMGERVPLQVTATFRPRDLRRLGE
jgi:hypothetical protein